MNTTVSKLLCTDVCMLYVWQLVYVWQLCTAAAALPSSLMEGLTCVCNFKKKLKCQYTFKYHSTT